MWIAADLPSPRMMAEDSVVGSPVDVAARGSGGGVDPVLMQCMAELVKLVDDTSRLVAAVVGLGQQVHELHEGQIRIVRVQEEMLQVLQELSEDVEEGGEGGDEEAEIAQGVPRALFPPGVAFPEDGGVRVVTPAERLSSFFGATATPR